MLIYVLVFTALDNPIVKFQYKVIMEDFFSNSIKFISKSVIETHTCTLISYACFYEQLLQRSGAGFSKAFIMSF